MQKLKLYRQFDQIMNQLNPTDLYRTPHPTTANYAFFFQMHMDHLREQIMLSHKSGLDKFQRTEIIVQCIF